MKVLVPNGRLLEECECLVHAKAAMEILMCHCQIYRFYNRPTGKDRVLVPKMYAECVKLKPH